MKEFRTRLTIDSDNQTIGTVKVQFEIDENVDPREFRDAINAMRNKGENRDHYILNLADDMYHRDILLQLIAELIYG